MYDRPSATELLEAARHHLETQVIPVAHSTNFKLYFQTLVSINVLKIVAREISMRGGHLRAEWSRLNMLLGGAEMPTSDGDLALSLRARNDELCQRIRAGEFDDDRALFQHLKATTTEQLEVANPKFLQQLADEA
jgi:hypothetical protein